MKLPRWLDPEEDWEAGSVNKRGKLVERGTPVEHECYPPDVRGYMANEWYLHPKPHSRLARILHRKIYIYPGAKWICNCGHTHICERDQHGGIDWKDCTLELAIAEGFEVSHENEGEVPLVTSDG